MAETDLPPVHNNSAAQRFETEVEGKLALIAYVQHNDGIIFTHTEVPPEIEGRGVAAHMAKAALDYARDQGLRVVPRCPYMAAYIRRHPEYETLVS